MIFIWDPRTYSKSSLRLFRMAMEARELGFQAMLDLSATKALCKELVRKTMKMKTRFINNSPFIQANGPILQENDIWNVIIQLTCGLRAIHQANLACRSLDPSKIITDGKRVRFSFLGMTDIVAYDSNQQNPLQLVNHYQQVRFHKIL